MSQTLVTLPFDGTPQNPRPVKASDRRMLYRDLWSDMILERFSFAQTGDTDFDITGVLIVDGAYARYSGHSVSVAGQAIGAAFIVARIGEVDGAQNVQFFFAPQGNPDGGLVVASLHPQGAALNPNGVTPSPIRIPDGTIQTQKIVGDVERWHFLRSTQAGSLSVTGSSVQVVPVPSHFWGNFRPSDALRQGTNGVHVDGVVGFQRPVTFQASMAVRNTQTSGAHSNFEVGFRFGRLGNTQDRWVATQSIDPGKTEMITTVPMSITSGPGVAVWVIVRRTSGAGAFNVSRTFLTTETFTPIS